MDIVERITELAQQRKLSGIELGNLIGLKKSPLTDWKNKKSSPTVSQVEKICEIFGVSSDYLIFGEHNYFGQELSEDEKEMLCNYKKLDSRGRHTTHSVIYREMDRMKTQAAFQRDDDESDISSEGDFGVSGLGYDSFMVTNGAKKR